MKSIFVSHAHDDEPLAMALAKLFEKLFEGKIQPLNISSRRDNTGGGIDYGEDWFGWIVEQVRDADYVFIVLTPNSSMKPWVIWEAGAAAGAAMSGSEDMRRPLIPIVYGMEGRRSPGPLERLQVVKGDQRNSIDGLVEQFWKETKNEFTNDESAQFGGRRSEAIDAYLTTIGEALPRLPIPITEAAIQEWISRLDRLRDERRQSEAKVLERWIDIAFGRNPTKGDPPLDLRVHRRLAELYQASGKSALPDAKRQLEYARTIAPRDILILRALGKVKLDDGDKDGCEEILEDIEEMDKEAFLKNPENAALKARYLRERGNTQGEIDVLQQAFGQMSTSHYIGDLLGQALLEADQGEEAKKVYISVLKTMSELVTDNVWSEATRLTAALVCDQDEALTAALERLDELRPDAGERESISGGIERVSNHMALSESVVKKLKAFGWA